MNNFKQIIFIPSSTVLTPWYPHKAYLSFNVDDGNKNNGLNRAAVRNRKLLKRGRESALACRSVSVRAWLKLSTTADRRLTNCQHFGYAQAECM